jgi:hypothetical protein
MDFAPRGERQLEGLYIDESGLVADLLRKIRLAFEKFGSPLDATGPDG